MASGWSRRWWRAPFRARLTTFGVAILLTASVMPAQARPGSSSPPADAGSGLRPEVRQALRSDTSVALRDVNVAHLKQPRATRDLPTLQMPKAVNNATPGESTGSRALDVEGPVNANMPAFDLDFEGVGNVNGVLPPDTVGDVGPNHYMQWVNLSFQIWDKEGNSLLGPLPGNALWDGFGGACENQNNGDPIVLYDHLSDRWMASQFALFSADGNHQCIAISQTGDPTGEWHRYDFVIHDTKINDYPHFGLWPDGWYLAFNQFDENTFAWQGQGVAAFDRAAMIAGDPDATMIYFDLFGVDPNFGGQIPSDLDGFPPPAGAPNYFIEADDSAFGVFATDRLSVWEFHADFDTPANSTFGIGGQPNYHLDTAPFDMNLCGFNRSCIPQPETGQGVDALSDRLLHRLQYRNFGDHQSLVANHTVDVDGSDHAGIRWYELRATGGPWAIEQQGTYAPDSDHRWMGSAAMDASGNIAVGYSVSSETTFPSIRAAGRLVTDPPGELSQGEQEMFAGTGSQTHSAARWGDYSSLNVDPVDQCTLWYTQEYLVETSVADWHTRIGHFKFPSCTLGPSGTLTGTVTDAATNNPIEGATVTADQVSTSTDADGVYQFTLPVGDYDMSATAYGYETELRPGVQVLEDQTTTEDFALDAVPAVTVTGTVTDGSGHGWPLYARIDISGYPFGPVFTNPETGEYSVELVQETPFTFTVNAMTGVYTPAIREVSYSAATATENFALEVDIEICDAPGYEGGEDGLREGFDTEVLPDGWAVVDNIGNGQEWVFDDPADRGNLTGGTGGFAIVDSDFYGPEESQDTELVTPVIDLTTVDAPQIQFDMDYLDYSVTAEISDVDLSIDGGTTWENVFRQEGTSLRTAHIELDIPQAANQANVQVRFHYYDATFSFWWEVDNVLVGTPECNPIPGGLIVGNVYDEVTGDALDGATVASVEVPEDATLTGPTPEDPGLDDGFYTLFSTLTGAHDFTASKTNYASATATVNVVDDGVVRQNFELGSGHLVVSPTELEVTVLLDETTSDTLTISNDGTADATFEIGERDKGSDILQSEGARMTNKTGQYSPLSAVAADPRGPGVLRPIPPPYAPPWVDIAEYPVDIMDSIADTFDGKVYGVSGISCCFEWRNNLFSYDPATNAWTELSPMSIGREKPNGAIIDGKFYVVGGWDPNGAVVDTLEIYDIATDTWTTGASVPTAYAASSNVALDGKLYLIGGCQFDCGTTDVWVYDPAGDAWSQAADYPETISWTHCGPIDGLIYCAGGTSGSGTTANAYVYDPGSDTWSEIAPMPQDQWAGGYVAANDLLIVSGGVTDGFATLTNEGFSYDPAADAWSSIPNSNNTLYRGASACGFYRIGGSSGGFSPVPESELLPGLAECGAPADVPWLSEDPVTGTVPAGGSVEVTVNFDAGVLEVPQPGEYRAELTFKEDTPHAVPPVPVTMNVTPPATFGKLQGTVVGLGQCDVPGDVLANASVHIDGVVEDFDIETDDDGYFEWWMDESNSPLTLTVSKEGWVGQTREGVIITGGVFTTEDFTLRLAASCLSSEPDSITKTQLLGTTSTQVLEITNTGALDAEVTMAERKGSFTILGHEGSELRRINGATGEFTPAFLGNQKGTHAERVNAGAPLAPTWSGIAPYPMGIMDNSADVIDGMLYVVGGIDGSFTVTDQGFVYDPSTDAWTAIASMPAAREKPGVAAVNGMLYVSGGWDPNGNPVAQTDVYDPATDSWSSVSDNPSPAAAPGVAVDGSSIYFVGGCQDGGCTTAPTVVAYDTSSDSWSSLADYPHNNAWQGCGGIDGQIYCAGGTDGNATFTDGFAYNPGSDSWSPIADMPLDLWASAAGAPNGLLVLSGGVTDGFATITNEGVAYDPAADSWSAIPNAQFPRYRAAGSCGFYKVGGSSAGFSPTPDSERLSELDQCGVSDVPWLSEEPAEFTVPADGGSVLVTVTLTATPEAGVDQPGTYTANIILQHNTRDTVGPIPVTLNVTPPRTWAKVAGTVLGQDCQGNTAPLQGAQVRLNGQFGYSFDLSTDAAGKYARWLDAKFSQLTVIASKDGYVTQFKQRVVLKKGKTTTVNFTLQKLGC